MNIDDEIIKILENNNVNPILSGDPEFLGIIRIYEEEMIDIILTELESFFNKFTSYSITSSHVKTCCTPSFQEIRYKLIK